MPPNNSSSGTADIRDYFEQALNSPRGIRIKLCVDGAMPTEGEAIRQRQRFYSFRSQDRKANKKIYGEDHPMFGKSAYDGLTVEIDENRNLIIRKVEAVFKVEEL